MITSKSIKAYREAFPSDICAFAEPSSLVLIVNSNGESYISPFNENDEQFIERLNRSKVNGTNYFYHDWEKYKSNGLIN